MIIDKELYRHHGFIKSFVFALRMTATNFFRTLFGLDKRLTINYPAEKYFYSDRFRGKPALTVKEHGPLRCNSCMLCVSACPAKCIHITTSAKGGPTEDTTPVAFHIELLRCIFCGICEQICPVDAIRLTGEYEMSGHAEEEWLMDHHQLAYRKSLNDGEGLLSVVDENAPGSIRL